MDPAAQWEIAQYARTMGEQIVQPLFPLAWEAFVDYRVEGLELSRLEQVIVGNDHVAFVPEPQYPLSELTHSAPNPVK